MTTSREVCRDFLSRPFYLYAVSQANLMYSNWNFLAILTGYLYTLSDDWAVVLITFLAVWLSLAGPYVFGLLKYPLLHLFVWLVGRNNYRILPQEPPTQPANLPAVSPQPNNVLPQPDDDVPDPAQTNSAAANDQSNDNAAPANIAEVLESSKGGRDLLAKATIYLSTPRPPGTYKDVFGILLMLLVFLLVFAARAAGGDFSAKTGSKGSSLWYSEHCGIWRFPLSNRSGDAASTRADVYNRGKETRAAEYAKYCYGQPSTPIPLYCRFFQEQSIPYTRNFSWDSPFPSDRILVEGVQPITFDTGLVDASVIGINDEETYKFRRRTTCTPLNTDAPYVIDASVAEDVAYKYYYGAMNATTRTNYTFLSEGDPFDWLSATYDVRYGTIRALGTSHVGSPASALPG